MTEGPLVVLAPMAGITNRAYRTLCREFGGAAIYVSEMITSRALLERHPDTLDMVAFGPQETPRSLQLYGVDPRIVADAVAMVVDEDLADHVDLNFGCPVPKVTRKGGGSALPWKRQLFRDIVEGAVGAARGRVPVSVKMRTGIDPDHLTYLDAGRTAARAGVAWVALHGRTASQFYGGTADWTAIARLKEHLAPEGTPVLGNGDIWTAADALRMVAETGCDGVVVGRGCLGRPWLFGQLEAAFGGRPVPPEPDLGEVSRVLRRHAALLCEVFGEEKGCREIRKHIAWYLKGFPIGSATRRSLGLVASLHDLDALLAPLDPDLPTAAEAVSGPRGRTSGERRVALPEDWLVDRDFLGAAATELSLAEIGVSGG